MDEGASGHSFQDEMPESLELHPGVGDCGNDGSTVRYTAKELEEFLSDGCRWTIFEDTEDEIRHLKRRGDVLSAALLATQAKVSRLQDAGVSLQEAYEALQQQFRQVVGDTAYWKALAEARAEQLASAHTFVEPEQGPPEPEPTQAGPREALRAAAAEAVREAANADARRWRRTAEQSCEEVGLVQRGAAGLMQVLSKSPDPEAASCCPPFKASEFRQGAVSPTVSRRAPPESRLCKEACGSNSGRSSPSQRSPQMSPQMSPRRSASAPMLVGGTVAEPSTQADGSARKAVEHSRSAQSDAARRSFVPSSGPSNGSKWGPGISLRRCPGLGTPLRKAHSAGSFEVAGKMTEDSGAQMRPCAMSSDVPLRSPSACGGTGTAPGLHQCGVGGTRRRRPVTLSPGAPSSRCGRATAGSPTPCIADLVDLWEGKQRESETDVVLMPKAMAACAHEKSSRLALMTASPQRRTSKMAGRFRT